MDENTPLIECNVIALMIVISEEQVTRGHNIVADGWAGASNPHPHPDPPQHSNIHNKSSKDCTWSEVPKGPLGLMGEFPDILRG